MGAMAMLGGCGGLLNEAEFLGSYQGNIVLSLTARSDGSSVTLDPFSVTYVIANQPDGAGIMIDGDGCDVPLSVSGPGRAFVIPTTCTNTDGTLNSITSGTVTLDADGQTLELVLNGTSYPSSGAVDYRNRFVGFQI